MEVKGSTDLILGALAVLIIVVGCAFCVEDRTKEYILENGHWLRSRYSPSTQKETTPAAAGVEEEGVKGTLHLPCG